MSRSTRKVCFKLRAPVPVSQVSVCSSPGTGSDPGRQLGPQTVPPMPRYHPCHRCWVTGQRRPVLGDAKLCWGHSLAGHEVTTGLRQLQGSQGTSELCICTTTTAGTDTQTGRMPRPQTPLPTAELQMCETAGGKHLLAYNRRTCQHPQKVEKEALRRRTTKGVPC